MYRTLSERLHDANLAIENAQSDPDLQGPLAGYGYDAERLAEGERLLDTARRATRHVVVEYGEQLAATDALEEEEAEAREIYAKHRDLAEIAFREQPDARRALLLDGRRRRSLGGWIRKATTFYDNLLGTDAYRQAMKERFNRTREELEAAREEVRDVAAADSRQEKEKGEAEQSTEQREEAVDALDAWVDDFLDTARVVFSDDRQQLEKLGIVARRR